MLRRLPRGFGLRPALRKSRRPGTERGAIVPRNCLAGKRLLEASSLPLRTAVAHGHDERETAIQVLRLRVVPMKRSMQWSIALVVLGLGGWLGTDFAVKYWQERTRVAYREAAVTRGAIVAVVNSTGTIKPVRLVPVGSFVGGPIIKILVDYNAEVAKDQILAIIDPQLYEAAAARDRASLARSIADVQRVEAQLQQADNNLKRAESLKAENKDFISAQEMDQFKYGYLALKADLAVAKTSVALAQANLDQSVANLNYTVIRAPEAGIVIDRKIDPGQTVQAQFQTPELFIVAPDLKVEMYVHANVDEADIGMIRKAQASNQPVRFTVDSYPDDLFEGKIFQVRQSSTTTQNVVTYPVVVSAKNPDLKLMPGMTANLSFQPSARRRRRAADSQRGPALLPTARTGPPRRPRDPGNQGRGRERGRGRRCHAVGR